MKFLDNTINRYKQEGVLNSLKADTEKLQDFLVKVPGSARMLYENFLSLNREKQIEIAAVTVITLLIFFTAAGGFDFEGGVPDMDIMAAGIGSHRSLFTHSILIGFGIEFTGRFTLLLLNKVKNRMPADKHPAWDKIYSYIDKHKEKAIAAIWLGIGTHLIKDSGIFGGGVTPYKDLPFSMPMDSHQALFAANGTASQIFGINSFGN